MSNPTNEDIQSTLKRYPGLKYTEDNGNPLIYGEVELLHKELNSPIDEFSIEMRFPSQYPYYFPEVIETGGKIERIPQRHLFVRNNNELCLGVPPEIYLRCRNGITIEWFMENVLMPRLAEEYNVNHGGAYLNEYPHNRTEALWRFYSTVLKTNDRDLILLLLDGIISNRLPKGFQPCLCGGNQKFKKCHRNCANELIPLGREYLSEQLLILKSNTTP